MRSAALSETGLARTQNDDAFWCDGDRGIFIVADGAGSSEGARVASTQAVEVLSAELTLAVDRGLSGLELADAMHDAFREASGDIFQRAGESEELRDMYCSVVAAVLTPNECFIAHAGDVRAYLYSEGALHQVTVDDTPVAVMVKRGYLLPEKARTHQLKHVLVKSLGSQAEVDANLIRFPIRPRERLLICTDGVWSPVDDSRIREAFQRGLDLEAVCYELIDAARQNNAQDNLTVVIVEADRPVDRLAQIAGPRS